MKKIFCFVAFVIVLLSACPKFSLADVAFRSFKAQHITWTLIKHEIWADVHTYQFKGHWKRTMYSSGDDYENRPELINYRIEVTGIYKLKELSFTEDLTITLMNMGHGPLDEIKLGFGGDVWKFNSWGGAGYDPWLWPSKANISSVSGQFDNHPFYSPIDAPYAHFNFPHPLSFYALTKAQRRDIRMEESEAILSPCPDMYNAPRIKSPSPGQLFEWKRLHMSFEVDCRYNDYRSNYFEVELQWYKPGREQGAGAAFRHENDFRPYPNQPTLVLDMQPAANQYEYKSWGSGHLDLPIDGRYRLRVRAQVAGEINDADSGMKTGWSKWRHFVSGALKPPGGEALIDHPDAGRQQGMSERGDGMVQRKGDIPAEGQLFDKQHSSYKDLNKAGALSVRKIFRFLNPEENHEYKARKKGNPKKGYKELATVIIRIRSPQKTKISFLFKQRLFDEQQFNDLKAWESKEDDMRWMPDIQEYQYFKYNSLEPAQYQLIANPHKSEVRPDDLTPIRFTVIGNKERRMRERLKASATLEKKENEKIPPNKTLTELKRQSKFEVLSPPDNSIHHNGSLTVKIGSPDRVGFNLTVQEVLPDGVGLKVPMKIDEIISSDTFKQEGGRWVSTILLVSLDFGTRYQVMVTPNDSSISKGKMWSRFTILSKEVIDNQKKIKKSGAVQMKKNPMIEPSIVLGGKRSYGPNENVMFMVKGNPTGKPQVECFDGRRWNNKCAKDIRLQKMGAGAQTRYILRTSTGGRYRLRVGKLLSDEIKVEKPLGKKVAASGKEPVQVSPQAKKAPQDKKQTRHVQTKLGDTKKKMPVKFDKPEFKNLDYGQTFPGGNIIIFNLNLNPAYKNLKVKYEVYQKACKGKPFKVSTNNNFGKLPAGRYCVRAAYLGGKKANWSKGIPFVVAEKKKVPITPKKKSSSRKNMVTQ